MQLWNLICLHEKLYFIVVELEKYKFKSSAGINAKTV